MEPYVFKADIKEFDLQATNFHGENALFLADCAKLAYKSEEIIKQAMEEQLDFTKFKFFSIKKSTEAFIAGNDKMIIVAFRGTQEASDFVKDARFAQKDGPAGKVHIGFDTSLEEVWDNDEKNQKMGLYIKECRDNNQSIWFCGHSLGAALATLAAAYYVLKSDDPASEAESIKGIYTIGQPRVGNSVFAKKFDEVLPGKCFRLVNNNDIVTHIPPIGLLLRYTHVEQEVYIDSDKNIQQSIPFFTKLWDQFNGMIKSIGKIGLDAFDDHGSQGYVDLIEKNRDVNF